MPKKLRFLYVCRLRAHLTQEALAEAVGVPQETISTWENGLEIPPQHLEKLREIFVNAKVIPEETPASALEESHGLDIR